jgi:PhnB protein
MARGCPENVSSFVVELKDKQTIMSTKTHNGVVQPYLFFNGRCEEALEFYKKAIGAEVQMIMRYKESPEPLPPGMVPPGFENKVMHASFRVGQTIVMASDGCATEGPKFDGFSLSLAVSTPEEVDAIFNALAVGGNVGMPLNKTFWSPRFGMVTDKFGVGWMVTVMVDAHM